MNEQQKKDFAAYIADYVNEEIERGTQYIDRFMIENAINAWEGGADER
jgi:hypothetical protein